MPDTENGQTPATAPQPPTENQAPHQESSEVSSLANYMARMKAASSTAEAKPPQAGTGSPPTAATTPPSDDREQFIPRSRFDEVLNERNQLRQQLQPQPQPQQPQGFPPHGLQTGMQPMPHQQVQPGFSPTGMVGQQPQQQAPAVNVPDFNDVRVQREWRDKIANNPVTGLREFVSLLIQAEGGPLLDQFRQQILSQISPIQQSYVQQQLSSYAQQRTQVDPSFSKIAPMFNQMVDQALQRGYSLTPQVLQAIEGIVRAQSGLLTAPPPPAPRQVPFTEAPGGAGNLGQHEQPDLTTQQRAMAERFGMTAEEYAASLRNYG